MTHHLNDEDRATGGHHHPDEQATRRWAKVREVLRPHSHDLTDQMDPALEASGLGIRTTKITLLALTATAVAQLAIALAAGSVALFADLVHNLADAMTSIPLWIAFVLGRRARNDTYTYGYRRAEDLAGIFIVLMIATSLVVVGWESIHRLIDPQPMQHPGWVLIAGIIGVIGNEAVAVYRIRVGRRIGSAALLADGYHARTDTVASFAVVVAVVGTWLGYPLIDPIVGLIICGVIAWILKSTAQQVFRRLMDGVEPGLVLTITRTARAVPDVQDVGRVRARWTGHRMQAEVTVSVHHDRSVIEGHEIGDRVRRALLRDIPHLEEAVIHVDPFPHDHHSPESPGGS